MTARWKKNKRFSRDEKEKDLEAQKNIYLHLKRRHE